jgi:hypothetical protein
MNALERIEGDVLRHPVPERSLGADLQYDRRQIDSAEFRC